MARSSECCEGNSIRIQILIAPKFVLFLVEEFSRLTNTGFQAQGGLFSVRVEYVKKYTC